MVWMQLLQWNHLSSLQLSKLLGTLNSLSKGAFKAFEVCFEIVSYAKLAERVSGMLLAGKELHSVVSPIIITLHYGKNNLQWNLCSYQGLRSLQLARQKFRFQCSRLHQGQGLAESDPVTRNKIQTVAALHTGRQGWMHQVMLIWSIFGHWASSETVNRLSCDSEQPAT